MDVRSNIISDIQTTLNLLGKYSDKNNVDISSILASVVGSTKDKNLIDLFVLREYIKDKTSAILAADLDNESEKMEEETDGLDFDSSDLPESPDAEENEDLPETKEDMPSDNEVPADANKAQSKEMTERKQNLMDSAEGYIQAIDLGISNIQNGDVNLELVGQLIDLKSLIQDSIDKVNEADVSGNMDEATLNILEAVLNNLEPNKNIPLDEVSGVEGAENEEGQLVNGETSANSENNSSIAGIIQSVSSGSIEASNQITDLVERLNNIVDNPEEYMNPNPEPSEDLETDLSEEDTAEEDKEEPGDTEETEENEDELAEDFVDDVEEKDKKAATSSTLVSSEIEDDNPFSLTSEELAILEGKDSANGIVGESEDPDSFVEDEDSDEKDLESEEFSDDEVSEFDDDFGIDDDFGDSEELIPDDTTPYVDEIEDVDFGASDIEEKPEEESDLDKEEFAEDISDLRDLFTEKLDEIESKYLGNTEEPAEESVEPSEELPEDVVPSDDLNDEENEENTEDLEAPAEENTENAEDNVEEKAEEEKADSEEKLEPEDGLLSTTETLSDSANPVVAEESCDKVEDKNALVGEGCKEDCSDNKNGAEASNKMTMPLNTLEACGTSDAPVPNTTVVSNKTKKKMKSKKAEFLAKHKK